MKWTIIFLAASVLSFAAAGTLPQRDRRQIFGEADPKRVPEMMTNRAFVESQGKCVVATDYEAPSLCDRIGRRLRANLPVAIQKGDCPSACNQDEKDAIVYVIKTLKARYSDIWKSVVKHYKATSDQLVKLDAWITGNWTSSSAAVASETSSESSSSVSSSTVITVAPSTSAEDEEEEESTA